MKIAVDTNVFVALFSGGEEASASAGTSLKEAHATGPLAISPAVYSELVAGGDAAFVEGFLFEKGIGVDWGRSRNVWSTAGTRYGECARRGRQRRGDPGPRRILADFLIGAHALSLAGVLLTSDSGRYSTYFPELKVLTPEGVTG